MLFTWRPCPTDFFTPFKFPALAEASHTPTLSTAGSRSTCHTGQITAALNKKETHDIPFPLVYNNPCPNTPYLPSPQPFRHHSPTHAHKAEHSTHGISLSQKKQNKRTYQNSRKCIQNKTKQKRHKTRTRPKFPRGRTA
ncbi:hypothetical protein B0T21DRAFT_169491 [Apiosordaria backusii]|uniref:Uncharacterized protein n=1 Tax=Apiosordaria backusii TaxID=314023 RepID=A0AA40BP34_9PEZI|nr:hypothetical protein B0T21DRAFT_169491 [Apiosordaria backusii]